jgi:hypothetical protein
MCTANPSGEHEIGSMMSGTCYAWYHFRGCHELVENGKLIGGICID